MSVEKFCGKVMIRVPGGGEESGPIEDKIWNKSLGHLKKENFQNKNILILGLGGGSLVKYLRKKYPKANLQITAVDIDPVIVDIAKKYFAVSENENLKIILGDAKEVIEKLSRQTRDPAMGGKKYDYIFLDTWAGYEFPKHLFTNKFFDCCSQVLNFEGQLILNVWSTNSRDPRTPLFKEKLRNNFQIIRQVNVDTYNDVLFCRPVPRYITAFSRRKDLRQSPGYGAYIKSYGWKIVDVAGSRMFIRKIPLTHWSLAKIQRPLSFPMKEIEKICGENRVQLLKVELPFGASFENDLSGNGYTKDSWWMLESAARVLDIGQGIKNLWLSLSPSTRVNIHKGEKENLHFEWGKGNDGDFMQKISVFASFWDKFSKTKDYGPGRAGSVEKLAKVYGKDSFLLFVKKNNSPASLDNPPLWGLLAFVYDSVGYYHFVFSTDEGNSTKASYLGVWEMLKLLKKRSVKYFNFEGIYDDRRPKKNRKWKGFSEFKRRWGGSIVYYPHSYTKFFNPWIKVLFKLFPM